MSCEQPSTAFSTFKLCPLDAQQDQIRLLLSIYISTSPTPILAPSCIFCYLNIRGGTMLAHINLKDTSIGRPCWFIHHPIHASQIRLIKTNHRIKEGFGRTGQFGSKK
jgi:hypothetical protein